MTRRNRPRATRTSVEDGPPGDPKPKGRTVTEQVLDYLFLSFLMLIAIVVARVRGDVPALVLSAMAVLGSVSWMWAFVRAVQAWREPDAGRLPLGALGLFSLVIGLGAVSLFILHIRY